MEQINPQILRILVLADINKERDRQNEKYGQYKLTPEEMLPVIGEEHGEVCQAFQVGKPWCKVTDAGDKYTELIHLAASAAKAAELVMEKQMLNKRIDTYA